jgi:hypothetical protein
MILVNQSLVGLVVIDVEFDMENYISIPAIAIGRTESTWC